MKGKRPHNPNTIQHASSHAPLAPPRIWSAVSLTPLYATPILPLYLISYYLFHVFPPNP